MTNNQTPKTSAPVVAKPAANVHSQPAASALLQRKCACGGTPGPSGECEQCRKKRLGMVQRLANGTAPAGFAPPVVHQVLTSPGQALDGATRTAMESRFGHDFSHVKIHTDLQAVDSARAVNARAYTVGNDIVFGAGNYKPGTDAGRRLLAHELAHVVQQSGANLPAQGELAIGSSQAAEESAADRSAEAALKPAVFGTDPTIAPPHVALRRQEDEAEPAKTPMAPGNDRSFVAEGVNVTIFRRCDGSEFGMDKIESATKDALNAVFHSECISADRRTRMQNNLKQFGGLFIFCKQPGEMHLGPERCAESTGETGQVRLSSILFGKSQPQFCDDLRAVILHEIVHVSLFAQFEKLPRSCEMSCFNHNHGEPADLCKNPKEPNTMD